MGWEGIAAIAACIALVLSIFGVVFVFGKIVSRLESLEARVKEDREKNEAQHTEYAQTMQCVARLEVKFENIGDRMNEMKSTLQAILHRLSENHGA